MSIFQSIPALNGLGKWMPSNFIKKDTLVQMFPLSFKSTFFTEHLQVTASDKSSAEWLLWKILHTLKRSQLSPLLL